MRFVDSIFRVSKFLCWSAHGRADYCAGGLIINVDGYGANIKMPLYYADSDFAHSLLDTALLSVSANRDMKYIRWNK